MVGALAGLASWAFLETLQRVTDYRLDNNWLLWLLPFAGLAIAGVYASFGGRAKDGMPLVLDELHDPRELLPGRMAPMVFVGTVAGHLFGASIGREGVAVQMAASLGDSLARVLRLRAADRVLLLSAAIAGGFGSVFGVPVAGAVFALEVPSLGRVRYDAIVPALTASLVGNAVVSGLGWQHIDPTPLIGVHVDVAMVAKVAVAGVAFGLAGAVFIELHHLVRNGLARVIPWVPARAFVGGAATIGLALIFGREYLGLSIPLANAALEGATFGVSTPLLKLLFTAVALGSGFVGGEVTPLFVAGATLGSALAGPLHLPVPLLAAVGFVAVFAGASNTPITCTILAIELFGAAAMIPFVVGCTASYVASAHRSIYSTQRVEAAKDGNSIGGRLTIRDWTHRRRS